MEWVRLSEEQYMALTAEERALVVKGRPCSWCDEVIEYGWIKHTFVVRNGVICRPDLEPESKYRNGLATTLSDGLYGDCPHCFRAYAMRAG